MTNRRRQHLTQQGVFSRTVLVKGINNRSRRIGNKILNAIRKEKAQKRTPEEKQEELKLAQEKAKKTKK